MPPLTLTTTVQPGGTIMLNDLPLTAGDVVEVVIVSKPIPTADPTEGGKYPLRGEPYTYIDPFEPACAPDDWEANR